MSLSDFEGKNLDKLELKCKFFLSEVKRNNEVLWDKLFDSFEEADLEELPSWFNKAQKEYSDWKSSQ